jgi:hypothetical protein
MHVPALVVGLLLALAALLAAAEPGRAAEPQRPATVSAAAFSDSIGVNTHLTYTDTVYRDFPRIRQALRDLGIRRIRDGLMPGRPDQYERLRLLREDGVRAGLIVGKPGENLGRLIDTAATQLPGVLEAVEGPNEYDISGDRNWAPRLRAYQHEIAARVRGDARLRGVNVWGPSLVWAHDRKILGNLQGVLDRGVLHSYPGGRRPEHNIESEMTLSRFVSGPDPLVSTETGYHNALDARHGQPAVTEGVAGDYAPRLFLSYFRAGIRQAYWYELINLRASRTRTEPDHSFGLLRNDFSVKPAGHAIANLIRLVGDAPAEVGPGAPAVEVDVDVPSAPEPVSSLVLRRDDGSYAVALWREAELRDEETRRRLDREPLRVGVTLPGTGHVRLHRPSRSAEPVADLGRRQRLSVPLSGDVTVVDVRP